MKIQISKGVISVIGTIKEKAKIDSVSDKIVDFDSYCVIASGGEEIEYNEYWVDICYDSTSFTIADIKKVYKEAKAV